MRRATEVFELERRAMASSGTATTLVDETWWARSVPEEAFISVAAAHWEIVVTRQRGTVQVTVRGPETKASAMPIPPDAEFFGIELSVGTYMPRLPPSELVDTTVPLPTTARSFRLADRTWPLPDPDRAEALVDDLMAAGLLVHDPVVAQALEGDVDGYSTRTLERRVRRATGLSRGTWQRIRRAERAVDLLAAGMPASEVAHRAGYADQPHLARSLRRLVGQTPAEVGAAASSG